MSELMPYDAVTDLDTLGPAESLMAYRHRGGYDALTQVLVMTPEEVIEAVESGGLVGHGGAGYPTASKWRAVRSRSGPRYLVVNAAEGEPGSYKDRQLLGRAPHQVLEGILIAARAIDASEILVYVNDQFAEVQTSLKQALGELVSSEFRSAMTSPIRLVLETHVYIAGEETALLNVLMGRPAVPWPKPPYPTEEGYYGHPTVVNNVETLAHVPVILRRGGDWYRENRPTLFSVTGDVKRPGVYELPLGIGLRELIDRAGGPAPGQEVQAVLPGGYSMPWLTDEKLGVRLDPESLRALGSGLGASVIVIGSVRSLGAVAHQIAVFLARESCGTCPICVTGTARLARALAPALSRPLGADEAEAIVRLGAEHRHRGICALLDQAAHMALTGTEALVTNPTRQGAVSA